MINFSLLVLISVITLIVIYYVYREAKEDIFRPTVTAGAIFLVFYIFDLFYIFDHSQMTDFFEVSGTLFSYTNIYEIGFVTIFCILLWFAGDFLSSKMTTELPVKSNFDLSINETTDFRFIFTIAFLTMAILLFNFASFLSFINSIGGFNWYYQNIADRALIFSENTFLYGFIQLTSVIGSIVAGYFIAIIRVRETNLLFKILTAVIILLVILLSLLTGARANVLKDIVIMLVITNYLGTKIKFSFKLLAGFILLGVLLVIFAEQSRNVETNANESMIDEVYNGVEISQINNAIILDNYNMINMPDTSTITGGLFSFIPGSLYEFFNSEKPAGGNAVFTESIWPDRWYRAESEVALGLLGETLLNAGYLFAPIVFFTAGFLYRQVYNILILNHRLGQLGLLLYIGMLWSIFQLLRGDVYNTVNNLFIYSVACFFSICLIKATLVDNTEATESQPSLKIAEEK